eukprot:TRINITY_DN5850_c0_g3_i1.p1 TRINITY_DN5850_c0_g3~~TRINITY_DN5850_c0_g3_i1.p1  ORF type:complete len:154 (+),score=23.59 TRINITY_DN5850_c0_g3_i1:247-708(+)
MEVKHHGLKSLIRELKTNNYVTVSMSEDKDIISLTIPVLVKRWNRRKLIIVPGDEDFPEETFEPQRPGKASSPWLSVNVNDRIRQVKSIYASTPGVVIRQIRLNYAGRLLAESKLPVPAVAEQSGYESMSSFAALFKKHFGKTPKDYQKSFKI